MSDWLFALLFVGTGMAFVVFGIQRFRSSRTFLAGAHRVAGMVVGTHRVSTTDSYEYFPILRFRTLDGADVETVGRTKGGSFELLRLKGREVGVFYDPRNPREASMDTSSGRALSGSVGMVLFGSAFAAIGVVLIFATAI